MMKWLSIVASLSILALQSARLYAYGDMAHLTVCKIAWEKMGTTTRQGINQITGNAPFADQCIWPDQVKKTPAWSESTHYHFINFNDGDFWGRSETLSPKGDMMLMVMAARDGLMPDSGKTADQKLCYLRFLGHLAGDSHQPLHSGRIVDRGGNGIPVRGWQGRDQYRVRSLMYAFTSTPNDRWDPVYFRPTGPMQIFDEQKNTNLHTIWDDALPDRDTRTLGFYEDEDSFDPQTVSGDYATFLLSIVTDSQREDIMRRLMADDLLRWFEHAYAYRPTAYDTATLADQDKYASQNTPIVRELLTQAGYHLAGMLTQILDPGALNSNSEELATMRHNEIKARIAAGLGEGTVFQDICSRQ